MTTRRDRAGIERGSGASIAYSLAAALFAAGRPADGIRYTRRSQRLTERSARASAFRLLATHYAWDDRADLRNELQRLSQMAAKVLDVHGARHPELADLAATFRGLREELESHMMKEERVLFPLILSGRGALAAAPINVMEVEHEDHRATLQRTRQLTAGLVAPADACTTWRALYLRLEELERELMEHIHLENNVLFCRALLS